MRLIERPSNPLDPDNTYSMLGLSALPFPLQALLSRQRDALALPLSAVLLLLCSVVRQSVDYADRAHHRRKSTNVTVDGASWSVTWMMVTLPSTITGLSERQNPL